MENSIELLKACKQALGVETDYKLAKALDVHRSLVSAYMAGTRIPDVYAAFRIAEILGRDPVEIIAQIEAERAKSEKRKGYWNLFWQRATKRAVIGMLALTFGFFSVVGQIGGTLERVFFVRRRYA